MKTVILSPHTDDAIFSLGNYIQELKLQGDEVTIISVFAGVPDDQGGQMKHLTLRAEHERACDVLGVNVINGSFLDDVYEPRPTEQQIAYFLSQHLHKFDQIICPIGIHHPDHILLRNTVARRFRVDKFYKELPYAELYPDETDKLLQNFNINKITHIPHRFTGLKEAAVNCYDSQLQNSVIRSQIFVDEALYD